MRYPEHIYFSSNDGQVKATREEQGGPWEINYPWGSDRLYATPSKLAREVQKEIRMQSQWAEESGV